MGDERLILLIEDDDAQLTSRALRQRRVANRAEVARDGAEALDWPFCCGAHAGRDPKVVPGLALLDLRLAKADSTRSTPAVDGLRLCWPVFDESSPTEP